MKAVMKNKRHLLRFFLLIFIEIFTVFLVSNQIVYLRTSSSIFRNGDIKSSDDIPFDADAIIVLGCGVTADKEPTPLLSDRLDVAIDLYNKGVAPKRLMSGDHGDDSYDEVNVMRSYAMSKGVPSEDIFMDHAGFSTYETIYRAKNVFGIDNAVIVTQRYHLFRTMYLAMSFDMNVIGVEAEGHVFTAQTYYSMREFAARTKDFFYSIIRPSPSFEGEGIDITGNGEVTLG